jgi:hypothetical protein
LHLSKELFFLNSGTTWASFNFSGKMELVIDLFIKFVIGLTIAGFADFRSFTEMPSRPVASFGFALLICFDTKSFSITRIYKLQKGCTCK